MGAIKPDLGQLSAAKWKIPSNLDARLAWEGRRVWRGLGWSASIGLVCGALAIASWWQTRVVAQNRQTVAIQLHTARVKAALPPPLEAPPDIERQLAAFYAYLPAHEAIPDQLRRLINVAEKNTVTLAQGDYKPQPDSGADFERFQIILPVKARYMNIQGFIVGALKELPSLTLESIAFKRELIDSEHVEAQIQFMLLVKKPVPKGGRR